MKKIFLILICSLILSSCTYKGETDDYQKVTMDAITSNNVNKCEKLIDRDKVLTCYVAYAYGKKEVSVCEKLAAKDEKKACVFRYDDLTK